MVRVHRKHKVGTESINFSQQTQQDPTHVQMSSLVVQMHGTWGGPA